MSATIRGDAAAIGRQRMRMVRLMLNLLIIALLILNAWYVAWLAFGYGTIRLSGIPANSQLFINGHTVPVTTKALRLRPGTYRLAITSPTVAPYSGSFSVGLLRMTTLKPTFKQRNPDAVAASLLGGIGAANAVHFAQVEWFNDNTWIAGTVALPLQPGLALHYDATTNVWSVAYFRSEGYSQNINQLPANVASYIKKAEALSVPG